MTCTLKNTAATNSKKGKDLDLYHQGPPAHSELIFVTWLRDKSWVSVFYIWIFELPSTVAEAFFSPCVILVFVRSSWQQVNMSVSGSQFH